MRVDQRAVVLGLLLAGPLGCGSEKDEEKAAVNPEGRGTPVCNEWQGRLCDWAQRCEASATAVAACREQAAAISCVSDERAGACATEFSAAPCSNPPQNCDIRDLVDPAPAQLACSRFGEAVCSRAEECNQSTKASCLMTPSLVTLCTDVVGYKLDFEQCISALPTWPCDSADGPPICVGVLLK